MLINEAVGIECCLQDWVMTKRNVTGDITPLSIINIPIYPIGSSAPWGREVASSARVSSGHFRAIGNSRQETNISSSMHFLPHVD